MRRLTGVVVLVVFLVLPADARPQGAGSSATGGIVGSVRDHEGPALEQAVIELLRAERLVARAWSGEDGRFSLTRIPPDDYTLVIRHIGYRFIRDTIHIADSIVRRDVRMQSTASIDSAARAEYRRKLAVARSRPRHWSCNVDSAKYAEAQAKAYETFMERGGVVTKKAVKFGMPRDRSGFYRDFRPLTQDECKRLAVAVDREEGLIEDSLVAFRIGRVFWLPELSGGQVANLSGKIVFGFVWLD